MSFDRSKLTRTYERVMESTDGCRWWMEPSVLLKNTLKSWRAPPSLSAFSSSSCCVFLPGESRKLLPHIHPFSFGSRVSQPTRHSLTHGVVHGIGQYPFSRPNVPTFFRICSASEKPRQNSCIESSRSSAARERSGLYFSLFSTEVMKTAAAAIPRVFPAAEQIFDLSREDCIGLRPRTRGARSVAATYRQRIRFDPGGTEFLRLSPCSRNHHAFRSEIEGKTCSCGGSGRCFR